MGEYTWHDQLVELQARRERQLNPYDPGAEAMDRDFSGAGGPGGGHTPEAIAAAHAIMQQAHYAQTQAFQRDTSLYGTPGVPLNQDLPADFTARRAMRAHEAMGPEGSFRQTMGQINPYARPGGKPGGLPSSYYDQTLPEFDAPSSIRQATAALYQGANRDVLNKLLEEKQRGANQIAAQRSASHDQLYTGTISQRSQASAKYDEETEKQAASAAGLAGLDKRAADAVRAQRNADKPRELMQFDNALAALGNAPGADPTLRAVARGFSQPLPPLPPTVGLFDQLKQHTLQYLDSGPDSKSPPPTPQTRAAIEHALEQMRFDPRTREMLNKPDGEASMIREMVAKANALTASRAPPGQNGLDFNALVPGGLNQMIPPVDQELPLGYANAPAPGALPQAQAFTPSRPSWQAPVNEQDRYAPPRASDWGVVGRAATGLAQGANSLSQIAAPELSPQQIQGGDSSGYFRAPWQSGPPAPPVSQGWSAAPYAPPPPVGSAPAPVPMSFAPPPPRPSLPPPYQGGQDVQSMQPAMYWPQPPGSGYPPVPAPQQQFATAPSPQGRAGKIPRRAR